VFDADGADATLAPDGAPNALGTPHDVPAARDCRGCHGGRRSRVLGYSAVQLGQGPTFGSEVDRAALGYLHANCSHCHNHARPRPGAARCYDPQNALDFRLLVSSDSVEGTPAYRTAVAQTGVFRPGHPESSEAVGLMRGRLPASEQMPPLATEVVDADGVALIERWVSSLAR
ncbi:MAG: hypothetical protein JNK82_28730, partial [Myxococcaceae bacterium]|nr:hypothetical protein [Myxococcaceae bacterium]